MNIYRDNIKYIKEKYPDFEKAVLNSFLPCDELEILSTPSGFPTGLFKGIFVHSKHNPYREAERLIQNKITEKMSCCIFEGFGLGYQVELFINNFPDIPLVIIEPDIPFFLKALSSRNMTHIFKHEYINFLLGADPDAAAYILNTIPHEKIHVLKLRSIYSNNIEYFSKVDDVITAFISRKDINYNTLKRFGHLWVKNFIHNITLLSSAKGISSLEGVFRGIPALLIAAGPSVDSILPYLSELKKRFILIAVDTTCKALADRGITPDFTVVVDPQYWNTRHLDWCTSKESIIISESSTHPRVFRQLNGPLFFCSSLFPLGQYIEKYTGITGKLGAGGSVATSAWDFIRTLGSQEIFCAGLDLGFPGYATHYKDSFFEKRAQLHSIRTSPQETISFKTLHEASPFFVPNNSGGKTFTDKRFYTYKWWFENQVKIFPDVSTYNLSPSGIKIEGVSYRSLDETLSFPVIRDRIDNKLSSIHNRLDTYNEKEDRVATGVNNLINELSILEKLAKKGLSTVKNINKCISAETTVKKQLLFLDSLDRDILSSVSKDIAGFLLQPLLKNIINANEKDVSMETMLENSEHFYTELLSSSKYHKNLLQKVFDRI